MLILLDCRPLQVAGPDAERSRLILSAAAALSASDGIEWLMVVDHHYRQVLFPTLPGRVVIRRAFPGRTGWRWWYDRQLPQVATQMGVEGAWLTGGITGGMKVPVCLWMPERANRLDGGKPRGYETLYRSRIKPSLERAAAVICYSEQDRTWLGHLQPDAQDRVLVASTLPDEKIGPMSFEEKEKIKTERTDGKEFFLADLTGCGEAQAVILLKAFSLFKKRQRSQMRLVLGGRMEASDRVTERLKTYKYREDVDLHGGVPAGAAYAVLLPLEGNSLGKTLLDMWKMGVPVIAAGGGLFEEMGRGAILEAEPGDPAAFAAQLMRIYKEEDLRQELARKGFERLKVYSRENFLRVLRVITEIAAC